MPLFRLILVTVAMFFAPLGLDAAEDSAIQNPTPGAHPAIPAAAAGESHHGPAVTPEAPTLFYIGPLPVTNAMVFTWVIVGLIFVVVKIGTRNLTQIPSG